MDQRKAENCITEIRKEGAIMRIESLRERKNEQQTEEKGKEGERRIKEINKKRGLKMILFV